MTAKSRRMLSIIVPAFLALIGLMLFDFLMEPQTHWNAWETNTIIKPLIALFIIKLTSMMPPFRR